jgi:hypothetical protein
MIGSSGVTSTIRKKMAHNALHRKGFKIDTAMLGCENGESFAALQKTNIC